MLCRRAERLCSDFSAWQALSLKTSIPRCDATRNPKLAELKHAVTPTKCMSMLTQDFPTANLDASLWLLACTCCLEITLDTSKSMIASRGAMLPCCISNTTRALPPSHCSETILPCSLDQCRALVLPPCRIPGRRTLYAGDDTTK